MTAETLAGRLVLRPGREGAVRCERPMVSAALLDPRMRIEIQVTARRSA